MCGAGCIVVCVVHLFYACNVRKILFAFRRPDSCRRTVQSCGKKIKLCYPFTNSVTICVRFFACCRTVFSKAFSPVIVRFNLQKVGSSELLHDARVMAMVFLANTHVVAVYRDEESSGGRVTFRKYDNDSDARRRGTFERLPARRLFRLWISSCEMVAITTRGSQLHCAAGDLRAAGDLLEQRKAELRVVLGSLELGWLHGPLVEAGIRSLASLRSESTSRLVTKLTGVGKQCNAAVCQKLLTLGRLTSTSDAPEPLVLMRD